MDSAGLLGLVVGAPLGGALGWHLGYGHAMRVVRSARAVAERSREWLERDSMAEFHQPPPDDSSAGGKPVAARGGRHRRSRQSARV